MAAKPKTKAPWKNRGSKYFLGFFLFACIAGIAILGTAFNTMSTESEYWEGVRKRYTNDSLIIQAERGNIYDSKGRLLVGSIPVYKLYIDFKVGGKDTLARNKVQKWRDEEFKAKKDSICRGLAEIFKDHTKKGQHIYTYDWFSKRLQESHDSMRTCLIFPYPVSFETYKKCLELPLFRERTLRGGFHGDKEMQREKPYGSLASRLLGSLHADSDRVPKNGIEHMCDSILRGKDGISHSTKVRNTSVSLTDQPPVDGLDIITTIDVDLQDAAEKSLRMQVEEMHAEMGVVIVMEVATGDVKAMVNLGRTNSGNYAEILNYAISTRMEPGSTFKTASIMVALEDGVITPETMVDTGNGLYYMHGCAMKDWGYGGRGGFGLIDVKTVMEQSSNIGVSRLIDENYGSCPEKFVDGLKRVGAGIPLDLKFPGAQNSLMKQVGEKTWSKVSLPWMSIGYESLLTPISTCTFYNGIANGGKMVRPRFVKAVMQDGEIVEEMPVEVLREKMCSDKTLRQIKDILENVVSARDGTGKKARCSQFRVCGKTGTAQIASGINGYKTGAQKNYLASFCGFFPAEAPKYTCLVCIQKVGHAGGGSDCGPVFAEVAQAVMATGMNHREPSQAADSTSVMMPTLSNGNVGETMSSLANIGLSMRGASGNNASWATFQQDGSQIQANALPTEKGKMPDLSGMGARDAVFALQCAGLKAELDGAGYVKEQSVAPGTVVRAGTKVRLILGNKKEK